MLPTHKRYARPQVRSLIRSIFKDQDSRNLFLFLLVNFSFAIVELVYGVWTNSLGLISDSFHMFFDCSALVVGLVASLIARKNANERYTFGYSRAEVLGGFINALFLVFVSIFILKESLERFLDPPHIHTHRLMLVAVLGLLVNLLGIFVFNHGGHGHSHGGDDHGHSHGSAKPAAASCSHGHSHGDDHGHAHGPPAAAPVEEKRENFILDGVLLHIISDTLGSVGVIISSFLVHQYDLMVADPICSLFIAVLTFVSTISLLKKSAAILMQRTPRALDTRLQLCYQKLQGVPDVIEFAEPRFWSLTNTHVVGTLRVRIQPRANDTDILAAVHAIFKQVGVDDLTVQLERSGPGSSGGGYYPTVRSL